jgi:Holliday junction resolvase RusA-like endonuclease
MLDIALKTIVVWLPGEPKGKRRPRFALKTGRTYTDAQTRNYEGMLRLAGQQAMGDKPLLKGAVLAIVEAHFTVPASWSQRNKRYALENFIKHTKSPDLDNVVKMLDALNGIVWEDDKQIVELIAKKRYGAKPGLKIQVTSL